MSWSSGGDKIGLALFGTFLILVGGITYLTPGLLRDAVDFMRDFGTSIISQARRFTDIPSPSRPHPLFYGALADFCALYGFATIASVAVRVKIRQNPRYVINGLLAAVFFNGMAPVLWSLESGLLEFKFVYPSLVLLWGISVLVRTAGLAIIDRRRTSSKSL